MEIEQIEPIARRHHFNPRVLLAGFTPAGKKHDHLWVFDATLSKPERRTPKAVAWGMDYYAIDVPGERPDFAEKVFGSIETAAAPVIRDLVNKQVHPTGERFVSLMYFLALMYIRGPRWREITSSIPEQIMDLVHRMALSTPERWAAHQAAMKEAGCPEGRSTYDEMKAYVESEGSGARLANPGPIHVQQIAQSLKWLPMVLGGRNWSLVAANDDAPDFVSSDSPVSLVWTDPELAQKGPPGLGFRDTEVAIAIQFTDGLLWWVG